MSVPVMLARKLASRLEDQKRQRLLPDWLAGRWRLRGVIFVHPKRRMRVGVEVARRLGLKRGPTRWNELR